jgi:hypothetical protein
MNMDEDMAGIDYDIRNISVVICSTVIMYWFHDGDRKTFSVV